MKCDNLLYICFQFIDCYHENTCSFFEIGIFCKIAPTNVSYQLLWKKARAAQEQIECTIIFRNILVKNKNAIWTYFDNIFFPLFLFSSFSFFLFFGATPRQAHLILAIGGPFEPHSNRTLKPSLPSSKCPFQNLWENPSAKSCEKTQNISKHRFKCFNVF